MLAPAELRPLSTPLSPYRVEPTVKQSVYRQEGMSSSEQLPGGLVARAQDQLPEVGQREAMGLSLVGAGPPRCHCPGGLPWESLSQK